MKNFEKETVVNVKAIVKKQTKDFVHILVGSRVVVVPIEDVQA